MIYFGLFQKKDEIYLEALFDDPPKLLKESDLSSIFETNLIHFQPYISVSLFNPLLNIDDNASRFLVFIDPIAIALNFKGVFSEKPNNKIYKQMNE